MGDKISSLSLVELRGVLTEVVRQAHEDLVALADALPPLEDGDRCVSVVAGGGKGHKCTFWSMY